MSTKESYKRFGKQNVMLIDDWLIDDLRNPSLASASPHTHNQ